MHPNFVGVTGLPRAGSTLLCQLLAHHPDMLFAKDKAIGSPLTSIHAVPDLPKHVQERLYFLRFEDLVQNPASSPLHVGDLQVAKPAALRD